MSESSDLDLVVISDLSSAIGAKPRQPFSAGASLNGYTSGSADDFSEDAALCSSDDDN